jgi:hypothetical protein
VFLTELKLSVIFTDLTLSVFLGNWHSLIFKRDNFLHLNLVLYIWKLEEN